ncbi:MAG: ATP-grasp domain-containing protein [Acidobacteriota bacterium]|nr:ATP-grasp domain-containing protein [Acidobacteriota bacterium]
MRIIVLAGNENQAVACVRSLARAGHQVSVGAHTSWSKAGLSRDCQNSFTYPAPQADADAFVKRVVEEARREPETLILPMTERTTLPLSQNRELVYAAGGHLALPPHEVVLQAFDKQYTTRLAESLGVAVPQTVLLNEQGQANQLSKTARYPVVLKPRSSEEVSRDGQVSATGAPIYARDAGEFMTAYGELSRRCSGVLVQDYVEGAGVGYFALMRDGELRAEFAHRRLRDVRPTGSGSALRESALPDARVREAALAILAALKWHGVAMVEFRQRADGTPVFMEVNGRFWNSLPLAVYAGIDFPAWLAELAERGDVAPAANYQAGVRCRWMLGDFRHLIEVWRGAPAGYPGKFPGRLSTLLCFLTPVPGTFHDNFTLRDPLPEIGDWLDLLLRKLPAGLRKRSATRKGLHAEGNYSLS